MNRFWLSDETNNSTEVFKVGSTLFIEGQGLRPSTLYDFHLSSQSQNRAATLLACYSTDSNGELAATPLLPCVGLCETDAQPHADGNSATAEHTFVIRARARGTSGPQFEELEFTVTSRNKARRIFACDPAGRTQTGIEKGDGQISAALHNFPAGCVRVFLVPLQFGWSVGDRIKPVTTRKGAVCSRLFYHYGAAERIVTLANSRDVPAGSYQFIARVSMPGWHDADEPTLLRNDIVSDRRFASLVVRLPFAERFAGEHGVTLRSAAAGSPLAQMPCSGLADHFSSGTDLDAAVLSSGLVGSRAAVYVMQRKASAKR